MAVGSKFLRLARHDGGAPRVLLAGGTPAQATVASVLVEQFGCHTRYVGSSDDLLSELRRSSDADLILLDQAHPDGAGALAVPSLRAEARRRGLPFVRLAGATSPQARAVGVGVVSKPYSPRDLFTALQAALAQDTAPALIAS